MNNSLYVDIDAYTSKFNAKLEGALGKLDGFAQSADRIGGRLTMGVTAPLLAIAGAMIKTSSSLEESLNKVDVAFKDSSDQIKAFGDTSLRQFGISRGSALDMAALYGDMATSMGISTDAAADMSVNLVGLAGDLSSFKNIQLEVANTALKSIFTGETESLKALGIVMTEANLAAFALSNGVKANIRDMSESEKVNLRYAFVMSKTANAQGDFLRTSGSAANQMRIFSGTLKQLGESFGTIILPYFTKAITAVNKVLQKFGKLDQSVKRNILFGAGIVALVGPALLIFSKITLAVTAIGGSLGALSAPAAIAGAALVGTAFYVLNNWEKVRKFFFDLEVQFFKLKNTIGTTLYGLGLIDPETAFGDLGEGLQNITRWSQGSDKGVQGFANSVKKAKKEMLALLAVIKGGAGLNEDGSLKTKQQLIKETNDIIDGKKDADKDPDNVMDKLFGSMKDGLSKLTSLKSEIFNINQELITDQAQKVRNAFDNELANYRKLLFEKKISTEDFNNWKTAREKQLQNELDSIQKGKFGNVSELSSLTESTLSKDKQTVLDVAKLLGLDPEGASQKFAERMEELKDKIQPIAEEGMENITSNLSKVWGENGNSLLQVLTQVTGMLAEGFADGLASIFNQDIDFDFKNVVAELLKAVGQMFIAIATPIIAAWALANIAGKGIFAKEQKAALGLLAAGIAMRAGGSAMSSNASSNAQVNNNGGSMGYGSQFTPQSQGMTVNIVGSLEPIGGDKLGVIINNASQNWNG